MEISRIQGILLDEGVENFPLEDGSGGSMIPVLQRTSVVTNFGETYENE